MKKYNILFLGLIISLGGCATQTVVKPTYVDQEPRLIGEPISQKINHSKMLVDEQFSLLNKIERKEYVGQYQMIKNNNDMDARNGSPNTVPRQYVENQEKTKEVKKEEEILNKKIKLIDWKDYSANQLGEKFANALGYNFASNNKDVKIVLKIENQTLKQAIQEYIDVMSKYANVLIVPENKTFSVIYK